MNDTRRIPTERGELVVLPVDAGFRNRLRLWPKGVHPVSDESNSIFQLGVEDDEGELTGILLGYGYSTSKEAASKFFLLQRLMLPAILAEFFAHSFRGVLLPCPCLRQLESGYVHVAYALFGRCEAHSSVGKDWGSPLPTYERVLGPGGSSMVLPFAACVATAWKKAGLKSPVLEGLDPEHWSACGKLALDLMVVDDRVAYLGFDMLENDPIATSLVEAGLTSVLHMPVSPIRRQSC